MKSRSLASLAALAMALNLLSAVPGSADCTSLSSLLNPDDTSCSDYWKDKAGAPGRAVDEAGRKVGETSDAVGGAVGGAADSVRKKAWELWDRGETARKAEEKRKADEAERKKNDEELAKARARIEAAKAETDARAKAFDDAEAARRAESERIRLKSEEDMKAREVRDFMEREKIKKVEGGPLGDGREPARQPGGIKLDARPAGTQADLSAERERVLNLRRLTQ